MQHQVTRIIEHMARSQAEMASILEAERHVTVHMARLVHEIPAELPGFPGIDALTEHAMSVTKNVAAYLNSLADLEDALADQLAVIVKIVDIPEGEE